MANGPDCRIYEFFGIRLPEETNGSNQYVVDCPFCDHEGHFYINKENALFCCMDSACGCKGNPYTFMELLYEESKRETTPFSYRRLSAKRKRLPQAAFKQSNIVYSKRLDEWLIPYRNREGRIVGLCRYSGEGAPITAPGCSLHLYGLERLQETGPIFLCEGQWDAIALSWLLSRCANKPEAYTVLAVPGASNLPKSDVEALKGRDVYLMFDNDEAGRAGMKSACHKLNELAADLMLLSWPEGTEEG